MSSTYWQKWSKTYKEELEKNIMPFWMKHGFDRKNGGVYTCLNRDGSLMDTTKSVWFQGRFGWMTAYAYNHVRKNPAWLEASKSCCEFLEKHCFDKDGRAYFEVTEDGVAGLVLGLQIDRARDHVIDELKDVLDADGEPPLQFRLVEEDLQKFEGRVLYVLFRHERHRSLVLLLGGGVPAFLLNELHIGLDLGKLLRGHTARGAEKRRHHLGFFHDDGSFYQVRQFSKKI